MPFPPEHLFNPSGSRIHSSPKVKEPDLREKIRERDRQRKHDDAAARRLELRRVKEQLGYLITRPSESSKASCEP